MLPPVFALLSAAPAVTAMIGTSPVRCWEDVAPQASPTRPYVVWSIVGGGVENYLDGVPGIDPPRVRIGVWSDSVTQRRALMIAVRNAIEPSSHMIGQPVGTFEEESKLYGYWMDFQFWVAR